MSPRWPGMALAVFLCLSAVATSAHAECAWVLWKTTHLVQNGKPAGEITTPVDAHTTPGACNRDQIERSHAQLERLARQNQEPDYPGKFDLHFFKCWPDTIDPRGPKGK